MRKNREKTEDCAFNQKQRMKPDRWMEARAIPRPKGDGDALFEAPTLAVFLPQPQDPSMVTPVAVPLKLSGSSSLKNGGYRVLEVDRKWRTFFRQEMEKMSACSRPKMEEMEHSIAHA